MAEALHGVALRAQRPPASSLSLTQTSLLQLSSLAIGRRKTRGRQTCSALIGREEHRSSCSDYHISVAGALAGRRAGGGTAGGTAVEPEQREGKGGESKSRGNFFTPHLIFLFPPPLPNLNCCHFFSFLFLLQPLYLCVLLQHSSPFIGL